MFIHTLLDYAIQILYNIESKFPARNMPQIHKNLLSSILLEFTNKNQGLK